MPPPGNYVDELDRESAGFGVVLIAVAYLGSDKLSKNLGIAESVFIKSESLLYNDAEQYFDKEIIIPRLGKSEVFVDAGSYNFMNSEYLLKYSPGVEKIYAFEPKEECIEVIKERASKTGFGNVQFENRAVFSTNGMLGFAGSSIVGETDSAAYEIEVCRLDDVISEATFIKMDIEGSEMEALAGVSETIKRCKPKLAICIYHKPFDYIDLPEYILSLVPEYKLYFRHYRLNSPAESVLYCVI